MYTLARQLLGCGYDDLTPIQRSVIDLIVDESPTGVHPKLSVDDRTFGQRLADHAGAEAGREDDRGAGHGSLR